MPLVIVPVLLLLSGVAFGQAPAVQRGIVREVVARWESNSYGDQWIVSDVTVTFPNGDEIVVQVEGGTIDDLTLTVEGTTVPQRGSIVAVERRGGKWALQGEDDFVVNTSWRGTEMTWVLDAKYAEMTAAKAERDISQAAMAWTNTTVSSFGQTQANFAMRYGGRIPDGQGIRAKDGRNTVLFRPTLHPDNPSAIASASWWTSGGRLIEADITGWSAKVTWFPQDVTCTGSAGADLLSIMTHEFGHVSGLRHSSVSGATMWPTYKYCSTTMRSLAADDIAGEQFLYPPQ